MISRQCNVCSMYHLIFIIVSWRMLGLSSCTCRKKLSSKLFGECLATALMSLTDKSHIEYLRPPQSCFKPPLDTACCIKVMLKKSQSCEGVHVLVMFWHDLPCFDGRSRLAITCHAYCYICCKPST